MSIISSSLYWDRRMSGTAPNVDPCYCFSVHEVWPMSKLLQTDIWTVRQAKNYIPPIFRYGDILKILLRTKNSNKKE
jgi:hypothetical protein